MPFSGNPWGYDEPPEYEEQIWEDDPWGDPASLSIWKPHDPDPRFTPTLPERNAYRAEMGRMAAQLSKENLGGQAEAFAPSSFGADYAPAGLGWTAWGDYQPKSRVGLSSWGWEYGLKDPFPILGGAIISPTIDIFTQKREQEYDEQGRSLHDPYQRVSSGLVSGRATVGQIMQKAAERGRAELEKLMAAGMSVGEAGSLAERAARQSVRSQTQSFGRADFGERWGWPYGLRTAIEYSANIRLHGDYGVGPKDLFGELGKHGYFTKATAPSVDPEHPERGAWQAYHMDSLYALGWFRSADGGFVTGTNKPAKRRQLGVQKLAAPIGADHLLRTGRLTGDQMLNTTAVFLDNYPFSEGSGVADPTLVKGFRDYRPVTIERPMRAGDDWQVRFGPTGQRGAAGESIFLGEQFVGGKWEPLEELKGIEGVSQSVFGHRKTKSGYQALIERDFPFESGTAKLMHHGMKALLFQSSEIIQQMQGRVRAAIGAGLLPRGVEDPRLVLPMPKDWLQTYRGMFDFLPEETLRSMGIADDVIKSRKWQKVGPGVVDKLHQYAEQRRFTFEQQHEAPVERLGAFTRVNNARDISYFERAGQQFARFTATHSGYVLPVAVGMRMEYPGKRPKYSPEELMQVAKNLPGVAKSLMRGNAASRIWGVAAAASEGLVPAGAISHETLPWVSARLGIDGDFDDEGTARTLVSNLARELKAEKQHRSAIIAPDGSLLPAPADVLGNSIKSFSGQEQSQFVSSYVQALKLMGTGQDATEALERFQEQMQTFTAGHNVRRDALGARLKYAAEGTFTAHLAIPDDVVVAGESTLRRLAGIGRRDPEAASKLDALIQQLEGGDSPFYVLGTRRPVSDMFNQLGVPMRVVTERMAQELYGVPIENLGRSYAVSPTVAAIWRGDVDADRALLHAVTRAKINVAEGHSRNPTTGAIEPALFYAGATFVTPKSVRDLASRESLMVRQLGALRTHAPDAYDSYTAGLSRKQGALLQAGLGGDTSNESLLALSEALHGIDVDWNESRKWSDSLITEDEARRRGPQALWDITKNRPHGFAWYADPANGTVFTREQMLGKFQDDAKSKMLMGRGYNRFLRSLTSLAGSPEELQASVTFAANIYQKALDGQKLTSGELQLLNMMESRGPTGAMFDKFDKEEGTISAAFAGGPAGLYSMLASAIGDVDAPASVRGMLFSRDPAIRQVVEAGGSAWEIIKAAREDGSEVQGARSFLEDPSRAGILPQLVQALHFSKGSIQKAGGLNEAEMAHAAQGERLRSQIRIVGRGEKGGLPVERAVGDMRAMVGLDTVGWWRKMAAERMGLPGMFFASDEEVQASLPSFNNPALPGKEFPAFISKREADVLEGLRQMPAGQAQQIAAAIGRPARYTPKGGVPSFDTGIAGWDKFTDEQRQEIIRMQRHGQPSEAIQARVEQFRAQLQQAAPEPGSEAVPPAAAGDPNAAFQAADELGPLPPWLADTTTTPPSAVQLQTQPAMPVGAASSINPTLGAIPAGTPNVYGFETRYPIPVALIRRPSRMAEYGVALEQILAKNEIDVDRMPPNLIGALMQSAPPGKSMELNAQGYAGGNYRFRMKLADLGLSGIGLEYLSELLPEALQDPHSKTTQAQIAEGYGTPGVGKNLVQAMRTFTALDLGAARAKRDTNAVWRGIEAAEKIDQAMGDAFFKAEGADARKEDIYQAYEDIQTLSAEDRQFAQEGIAAALGRQDFDYERVSLRDRVFAKAVRTLGQRPSEDDYLRMNDEERRKIDNQQRDAMITIRDRAGVMGMDDLGADFDQLQDRWISRGLQSFRSRSPAERNRLAHSLSQAAVLGQGAPALMPGDLAESLAYGDITSTQLRALVELPQATRELEALTNTPANRSQRMKLLNQQQGVLMTAIGMNEKGEAPKELVDALGKNIEETRNLAEQTQKANELEQQRVQHLRQQVEADPRYAAGLRLADAADAHEAASGRATLLDPQQRKMLKSVRELQSLAGIDTERVDRILDASNVQELLETASAGLVDNQPRQGGIRGALGRFFERAPTDPQTGTGAIENMFTELTLGWTAFRARMAWGLATGAQRGWMNDFMGEESSAVGAALAGGVAPGSAGMASNYLSAQAAMANARAQMGEGVAQVYSPLMASASQLGTTPGMGAALTMLGTPVGAASVAALGAKMVGSAFPAIGALAGPVGWGVLGTTAAALGLSYVAGESPEWVRYDEGTRAYNWRRAARGGELMGEKAGGISPWMGRLGGLTASAILGYDERTFFTPDVIAQLDAERTAWAPGTLGHDADKLRDWISGTYENRVPVDSALQLMGGLFQITGRTAEEVYENRAPEFKALMDRYVQYMEGGASPNELFNSQVSAAAAAGVPLGPQTEAWMVQFASMVPGQQRQMYEEAFKNLSPLAQATMRPTPFDAAERVVALAQSTGSMQRAANIEMGQQGVGWFAGTFGLEQASAEARRMGTTLTALPIVQQETVQRFGATVASSGSRMGMTPVASAGMATDLAALHPNDVLRVSNLVVQAESVALEAGENKGGFQGLVQQALAAGMEDKSAAMQRWFMGTQVGGAGIAPETWMPHGQRARQFESMFSLVPENMQDSARTAAAVLNQAYPTIGYSPTLLRDALLRLENEDLTIPQLSLEQRANAGRAGIGAAMGVPLASPGAMLIDRTIALGDSPFRSALGSRVGAAAGLTPDQTAALPGYLNPSMFQYMTSPEMASIAPQIGQMFGQYWNGEMSLYQFNQGMEAATGSTPWGFSARRGFGAGSLTDSLGRTYGQYTPWVSYSGQTMGPLFDVQMGASYASLGYASASNEAQHQQFYRQMERTRQEWGSGPFQSLGAVQAAFFPTDGSAAAEPGSGMQIGESTIGFAQQESAIRRQMWQESIAAQQQSIQFSRQSLEISRQELGIAKQELELSKQQYSVQRAYKLQEQQAQRGMQLRQYEWAAQDFAIKLERTGITQQWQMEDLQRSRRYATGRQRVEIERNIERAQITQGWERDDQTRGRNRELEVQRYQDQRYEAAVSFEQKLNDLQMQRFDLQDQRMSLQEQRLALQDAQLAAQEARLATNATLQEKLNLLEDERFKAQYEQTQAQMADDEKLEKLRYAARQAELAYQGLQLEHAKTMKENEETFLNHLKGIKEGGVLDKWIEFFNAIRAVPGAGTGGTYEGADPLGDGDPDRSSLPTRESVFVPTPFSEASIGREWAQANAQPVVVNFVLDGEVVMQALVKPERLRPVVQEIQRRDSWR